MHHMLHWFVTKGEVFERLTDQCCEIWKKKNFPITVPSKFDNFVAIRLSLIVCLKG